MQESFGEVYQLGKRGEGGQDPRKFTVGPVILHVCFCLLLVFFKLLASSWI